MRFAYANIHFDRKIDKSCPVKRFTAYFEAPSIFDNNWIASANNISNTFALVNGMVVQNGYFQLAQFGTGSIYAGNPRLLQGGVKLKF